MNTLRWVSFPFIGIITYIGSVKIADKVIQFLNPIILKSSEKYTVGNDILDFNIVVFILSFSAPFIGAYCMMYVVKRIIPNHNELLKARAIKIFKILMTTIFILLAILFFYIAIRNGSIFAAILISIPFLGAAIGTYFQDAIEDMI